MRNAGIIYAFVLSLSAVLAVPQLSAQHRLSTEALVPVEVDVDYNFLRANAGPAECGCFNLNGLNGEVSWHLPKGFRAVGEYGLGHTGEVNQSGHSLTLSTFTGGARYVRSYSSGRFAPFAQGLLGLAHGSGTYFPQGASGGSSSASSFAFILGGGFDLRVDQRFSIRALQGDFVHSALPNNSSNSQNLLRISAGMAFNLNRTR